MCSMNVLPSARNPTRIPADTPLLDDSPAVHALSSLTASLGFVPASFLLALTTLKHARDVPCLIKARLDSHDLEHSFEAYCRAEERGYARSSKSLHDALSLSLPCNNNDFRVFIHHSSLPASQGNVKMPAVQHPPDPAQRSNYEQRLKDYQPHGSQFVPAGYPRRDEYTQKNAVHDIEQQRVASPLSEDRYRAAKMFVEYMETPEHQVACAQCYQNIAGRDTVLAHRNYECQKETKDEDAR